METIENQSEEKLFYLSKDAMFASAISGLIGFFHEDNKTLWKKLTQFRLEVLMPETIDGIEDFQRLLFIVTIAQVVGIMEVEAEAFQKMRSCLNDEEFQKTIKVNYGGLDHTPENIEFIVEVVVKLALYAGWSNPRAAFSEIDALNTELQIDDMNLSEIFQI